MADVKPISPEDIGAYKATVFPSEVIEAFNELIAEEYSGKSATVLQKKVVDRIIQKMLGVSALGEEDDDIRRLRNQIFNRGWLNVEEIYRTQGWKVEYDKPAYCESFDAFFSFSTK